MNLKRVFGFPLFAIEQIDGQGILLSSVVLAYETIVHDVLALLGLVLCHTHDCQ